MGTLRGVALLGASPRERSPPSDPHRTNGSTEPGIAASSNLVWRFSRVLTPIRPEGPVGSPRAVPSGDELRKRVAEIHRRWPAVGLAVGVVRHGGVGLFQGRGWRTSPGTPITEDTVFRIGSITKTVTAIAVMQLWERGLVDLDAPANDYLRPYKLISAETGWRPATASADPHRRDSRRALPGRSAPSVVGAFRWPSSSSQRGGRGTVPSLAEYYRRHPVDVGARLRLCLQQSRLRHPGSDRRGRQR